MANICSNCMAVYGDRTELERLHSIIGEAMADTDPKRNKVDLTFELAGFTKEEIDALGMTACFYTDVDKEISTGDYGITYFEVSFESKWSPAIESWDALLARFFPKLKQVTVAEEGGCEIYINTDRDGYFFKDRYYVDGSVCNHYTNEMECPYCETEEQALAVINEMCDKAGIKSFGSIADALAFFEDEDNNPDPNPDHDFFLNVHEYSDR